MNSTRGCARPEQGGFGEAEDRRRWSWRWTWRRSQAASLAGLAASLGVRRLRGGGGEAAHGLGGGRADMTASSARLVLLLCRRLCLGCRALRSHRQFGEKASYISSASVSPWVGR